MGNFSSYYLFRCYLSSVFCHKFAHFTFKKNHLTPTAIKRDKSFPVREGSLVFCVGQILPAKWHKFAIIPIISTSDEGLRIYL